MATYMDPEEKEGRRKDGSITFVKIVWSMDIGIPIQEASHIATDGLLEEHCEENGLPEREDIVFDVTAISQVSHIKH